jgi:hypothetical protein
LAFRGREKDAREIGARLGVTALLEGTVRKAGDRLRVTAQLISTRDGYHLWAEQFDRDADDVFAVQDEIAAGVVTKLQVRLRLAPRMWIAVPPRALRIRVRWARATGYQSECTWAYRRMR